MDSESKRMARLIDDLLSLSRVEANEHILPDGQVELRALLADVTNTLSARANSRSITISFVRDGASVFTNGDWDELTEVFHNLIDNAVKYCPEHTTVRVEIDEIQRIPEIGLPGVVIAITDEGDGIPAEHLPRLTERFYRVDKGRSRTMGGTGLGARHRQAYRQPPSRPINGGQRARTGAVSKFFCQACGTWQNRMICHNTET